MTRRRSARSGPDEYAALGEVTVAAYLTVGEDGHDGYLDFVRDVATRARDLPGLRGGRRRPARSSAG